MRISALILTFALTGAPVTASADIQRCKSDVQPNFVEEAHDSTPWNCHGTIITEFTVDMDGFVIDSSIKVLDAKPLDQAACLKKRAVHILTLPQNRYTRPSTACRNSLMLTWK